MEIWKPLKNYEGLYEVSSHGRLRSLDRYIDSSNGRKQFKRGQLKKVQINKQTGYVQFDVSCNNKHERLNAHKVVAEHFIDNPNNYSTVNHKDGNKLNNRVDNLEWSSYSENLTHAYIELKRPINKPMLHQRTVYYTFNNFTYKTNSVAEASRQTGVSETQIRRLIDNGKTSRNGYSFSFKEPSVEDNERVDND